MLTRAVPPHQQPFREHRDQRGHRTRPEQHLLARSLDGGHTWSIEHPAGLIPPPTPGHIAGVPTEPGGRAVQSYPGDRDLTNPDFLMTFRMSDIHTGPSWFFTSPDRGRTWDGPWSLSVPDVPHIAARTDYIVRGRREAEGESGPGRDRPAPGEPPAGIPRSVRRGEGRGRTGGHQQASPGLGHLVAASLLGGLAAMVVVVAIAYYGTIATVRLGIDPDTYGIPLVSSTVDLVGALTLVVAIAFLGLT